MKFGTFLLLHSPDMLPAEEVYANAVAQAELADELGFDAVWLAEHHFSPDRAVLAAPIAIASAIALPMFRPAPVIRATLPSSFT